MNDKVQKIVESVKQEIGQKILEEEKNKKKKRFLISDTHFNDNRLNLYGRNLMFKNSQEVDDYIIKKWNETVDKNDVVYHLGDVSMDKEGFEKIKELNGKKILIKGNYDINKENGGTAKFNIDDKFLLKYFDEVYDELEIEIDGEKIFLNHFPAKIREDVFNICGHIHGLWKCSRNSINVGVDAWHFMPVSEDLIKFQMGGIRNHYDQNVYAGELKANIKHRKGEVKILRAPEYDNVSTFEESKDIVIFMAGPASGCENWQEEFMKKIQEKLKDIKINKNIILCNPRRLEKPKNFVYEEQVVWESYYLSKAALQGFIVFWFAKETEKIPGRSFARTSRFEIGEWFAKGQIIPGFKMIVGREDGFEGFEYIESRLKSVDDKFEPNTTKKEMVDEIVETIKKMI